MPAPNDEALRSLTATGTIAPKTQDESATMSDLTAQPENPTFVCAGCGADAATMEGDCPACAAPIALQARYGLQRIVGRGAAGTTWRALDARTGQPVAVKELTIRPGTPPEVRDRLHREARVLQQLDHDRIPRYVDDFEAGTGRHRAFYVVQAFVEGPTLVELAAKRRFSQAEVVALLDEVLAILEYLHRLAPPVIHRDVKPGNVIRRASDGRLVLIDFGAVRDAVSDPRTGGSTIAGTYGFMAPEQFRGHATAATDLYGVGAMAVALLSRRSLIDLVGADHRLQWKSVVSASPGLLALIERLLADEPHERPPSATAVRAALARIDLDSPAVAEPETETATLPPSAMKRLRAALAPGETILWIAQPKGRAAPPGARMLQLFAIPWTAFAIFWMASAIGLTSGGPSGFGIIFSLFGLPFVAVGIGMLTAPYWARKVRAATVQAVTDRQAWLVRGNLGIVESFSGPAVRCWRGPGLAAVERQIDGEGLSSFVMEWVTTSKGGRRSVGFDGVEDGDRVARLLREASEWDAK